jgi:hypothetical protein
MNRNWAESQRQVDSLRENILDLKLRLVHIRVAEEAYAQAHVSVLGSAKLLLFY